MLRNTEQFPLFVEFSRHASGLNTHSAFVPRVQSSLLSNNIAPRKLGMLFPGSPREAMLAGHHPTTHDIKTVCISLAGSHFLAPA